MKSIFSMCLFMVCSFAYAQNESEQADTTYNLDEVVVSANRWEQSLLEVPNKVSSVSQSLVKFQNPQTSADLLSLSNNVFIQKSQLGGGSPMIRGFATNRILLVVDGVRMNNAIFRAGNVQNVISIDPNVIQEAEVIFGPGSVIYGSDAIGGVMDFHSLAPRFSEERRSLTTFNSLVRYSSANNEKTGHANLNLGFKKFAFVTGLTYSDFGDLRMGSNGPEDYLRRDYLVRKEGADVLVTNNHPNIQKHTGYGQLGIFQKVAFKPHQNFQATYILHFSETSDYPRYDRLSLKSSSGTFSNAEWYYGPQKWQLHSLNLKFTGATKIYDQVQFVAGYQNYRESRHTRSYGSSNRTDRFEEVNAFSANLDLDKNLSEKIQLFFGAEFVTNKVYSSAGRVNVNTGATSGTSTRYPDNSDWRTFAIYASSRIAASQKFLVNISARYSHVYSYSPFDVTYFDFPFTEAELANDAVNGSLGVIFTPNQSWKIYSNFSTGFRAPNVDDVGKVFDSQPGNVVVPNANLEPERAYNSEIGLAGIINDRMKIDLALYHTVLEQAIVRGPSTFNGLDSIDYDGVRSRVWSQQNIGDVTIQGVQAGVDLSLTSELRLTSTVNIQSGKENDVSSGKELTPAHVAPFFGSTHIRFTRNRLLLDLYSNYNGRKNINDVVLTEQADASLYAKDENGDPYSPAWWTLNFKSQWILNKNFVVGAGIENILDKRYRMYASGISSPGINFILSVRTTF